jgi:hypothetical protein
MEKGEKFDLNSDEETGSDTTVSDADEGEGEGRNEEEGRNEGE